MQLRGGRGHAAAAGVELLKSVVIAWLKGVTFYGVSPSAVLCYVQVARLAAGAVESTGGALGRLATVATQLGVNQVGAGHRWGWVRLWLVLAFGTEARVLASANHACGCQARKGPHVQAEPRTQAWTQARVKRTYRPATPRFWPVACLHARTHLCASLA